VLASRVERLQAQEFDPSMDMRRITESCSNDRSIDCILVLGSRSIGSKKYNFVGREGTISTDGSTVDGKFVGGETFAATTEVSNICR
jgi:hypothetical protein